MVVDLLLQASPEIKGIKTLSRGPIPPPLRLQASPEFKGIKTLPKAGVDVYRLLQASPEFKGIKTRYQDLVSRSKASSQP